jgi:hypothetical protein
VIVLVEETPADKRTRRIANPLSRPLRIELVLAELARMQDQLRPSREQGHVAEGVGRARVVLLAEQPNLGSSAEQFPAKLPRLTRNVRTALYALATFRWGFSAQMAGRLLHDKTLAIDIDDLLPPGQHTPSSGGQVPTFLRWAEQIGILRCTRYGQGWYHLPKAVRRLLQAPVGVNPSNGALAYPMARRHVAAGIALAPYASAKPQVGLTLDTALQPEHIHEAERHFSIAYSLLSPSDAEARRANVARTWLLRYADHPSWVTVTALARARHDPAAFRDSFEGGKALLQEQLATNGTDDIHPVRYLTVARAGAAWRGHCPPSERGKVDDELVGNHGFFLRALKACDHPLFWEERFYNLTLVLSGLANYLATTADEYPGRKVLAAARDAELEQLLAENSELPDCGAWGDWFERVADAIQADVQAAAAYRRGLGWVPDYFQLWPKAFGAAPPHCLDDLVALFERYIDDSVAENPPLTREQAIQRVLAGSQNRSTQPWVIERWGRGHRFMSDRWVTAVSA